MHKVMIHCIPGNILTLSIYGIVHGNTLYNKFDIQFC